MKTMTTAEIKEKLIELGGEEWEKGQHHRVYVYPYVAANFFDSEHARFGKSHDVYFNVVSGQFFSEHKSTANNLNALLEELS